MFPTTLAASKVKATKKSLDGKNLIPYLTKQITKAPHAGEPLFWRYSNGKGYAVLLDNHKLIYTYHKKKLLLFDLQKDPTEKMDLSSKYPEKVKQLEQLYALWSKEMTDGLWVDEHINNVNKQESIRQEFIGNAMKGEKNSR